MVYSREADLMREEQQRAPSGATFVLAVAVALPLNRNGVPETA